MTSTLILTTGKRDDSRPASLPPSRLTISGLCLVAPSANPSGPASPFDLMAAW